jgi:hypothetical protein
VLVCVRGCSGCFGCGYAAPCNPWLNLLRSDAPMSLELDPHE